MLIKRAKFPTRFMLPVIINNKNGSSFKTNFYYESESILFKAYRQLKFINCNIRPLYPIIDEIEFRNGDI